MQMWQWCGFYTRQFQMGWFHINMASLCQRPGAAVLDMKGPCNPYILSKYISGHLSYINKYCPMPTTLGDKQSLLNHAHCFVVFCLLWWYYHTYWNYATSSRAASLSLRQFYNCASSNGPTFTCMGNMSSNKLQESVYRVQISWVV